MNVAGVRSPLQFQGGGLRPGTAPGPTSDAHACLHEVRADVEHHQHAAQQEEGDDEQRRHEADEDVGQREPSPHAPQQASLGDDEEAVGEDRGARDQADVAERVERLDQGRGGTEEPERQRDAFHDGADEQRAAGEGAAQPVLITTRVSRISERRRSGSTRLTGHLIHHRGQRFCARCVSIALTSICGRRRPARR